MDGLNARQRRLLSILSGPCRELYQLPNIHGAAWFVWHPVHYHVRVRATVRDVHGLVSKGLLVKGPFGGRLTPAGNTP